MIEEQLPKKTSDAGYLLQFKEIDICILISIILFGLDSEY